MSQIDGELEIDLETRLDDVDAVIFVLDVLIRGQQFGDFIRERTASNLGVRVVQQHAQIIFGNPGQAKLQAELFAAPSKVGRGNKIAIGEIVAEGPMQLAGVEVEVIEATDNLERANAPLLNGLSTLVRSHVPFL